MASAPLSLADNLPGWIVAGLAASVLILLRRLNSGPQISHFPLLGKEYGSRRKRIEAFLFHPVEMYQEGYRRFKDQVYRLTMPDVPTRYLDELRQLPDEEIDVLKSFQHVFANDYIHLFPPKDRTEIANSIVKVELTRNLVRLNPRLSAEVDRAVNDEIPAGGDWTPVRIFPVLLRIVAIVSGNLFVGPRACRDPAYLGAAIDFTADVTAAAAEIKRWPAWLRPLAARLPGLAPSVRRSQAHRRRLQALLAPMVEERRRRLLLLRGGERGASGVPADDGDGDGGDDVLQWMVEKTTDNGILDAGHLAQMQLLLTMAAIHTTSLSVTGMLYDLAMRPELANDIREEIASVLKETDGVMTSQALFNMKLLDSFMRESQRFTPPFVDSFRRYIQKPITLKDGTQLPAGTFIETPSLAVLHDPDHYEDPEVFNPYRFYHLRTKEDVPDPNKFRNREQYQFVSVTKENMSFGYGKHACPGRFFAANEIKLIMARILLQFDVRFPPGVEERYPNFYLGSVSGPSPTGTVEIRKAQAS